MKVKRQFLLTLQAFCLAILACLNTPSTTQAQSNTIRFDTLSFEDGLSQSVVLAILQDQQGFMWFGTEDGLNRYDGHTFTVHNHDPDWNEERVGSARPGEQGVYSLSARSRGPAEPGRQVGHGNPSGS